MRLTSGEIKSTVNARNMTAEEKRLLIQQCEDGNTSARFIVYGWWKKNN